MKIERWFLECMDNIIFKLNIPPIAFVIIQGGVADIKRIVEKKIENLLKTGISGKKEWLLG